MIRHIVLTASLPFLLWACGGATPAEVADPTDTPEPLTSPTPAEPPRADGDGAEGPRADETEGDELLVGLLGRWHIDSSIHATISALSTSDALAFHGREVVIAPAFHSPWESCAEPRWSHREVAVEAWLTSWKAPTLTAAEEEGLGLAGITAVTVWNMDCAGKTSAELAQPNADRLVILRDGVAFAARRRP